MKALFRRWMVVVTTGLIPLLGITTGCNGLERTSVVGNSSEVATGTTNATSSAKPGLEAATSPNPTNTLPATPRVPEPKQMSPGLEGVVKLAKAGIPEDVMLAYVAQTTNTFQLGPDELIYLTDIGVPPSVLIWMQQRAPGTSPVVPNAVAAAGSNSVPTNALAPAAAAGTSAPVAAAPAGVATPPPPAAPEPTTNVITPTYVAQPALPPVDPNAPPPPAGTTVVPTPVVVQQPVTVNYFYDALSPHGTWIEVPGYGRCWRPNYAVLGAGWQPYADGGHWVWTDFGWYWVSDYSWGWAPFHYGRWCHVPRHGWLWSPDTVWGPAWVCWRRTSSHCGWAPLPPGAYFSGSSWYFGGGRVGFDYGFNLGFSFFTFVPWTRFCEPRPHHFYASRNHAASLYRESTVVNNTVIGNHNNVVYQGVGRDVVQQASRTPIPQAAIRETAWTTANAGVRERMDQSQGSPIIQSPRITAAPPSKPGSTASSGKWAPSSGSGSSTNTNTKTSD